MGDNSYGNGFKYMEMAESIGAKIESGHWQGRMPTIVELAEDYQASPVTMQKAIDVLKERGAVRSIPGKGLFVSRIRRARTHTIGTVMGSTHSPLGGAFADGLQIAATSFDHALTIQSYGGEFSRQMDLVKQMVEKQRVDGLVLWMQSAETAEQAVEYLQGQTVPFVLVPEPELDRFGRCHTVSNSDSGAAGDVMMHLIGLGHRKIGFAASSIQLASGYGKHRYEQYLRSMNIAGLEPMEPVMADYTANNPEINIDQIRQCDALFCCNDLVAGSVLRKCLAEGITVPGDLAVAGYDNLAHAKLLGLTTVEQHFEVIGQRAVELLIDELDGKVNRAIHITVDSELIVRTSTARIKQRS